MQTYRLLTILSSSMDFQEPIWLCTIMFVVKNPSLSSKSSSLSPILRPQIFCLPALIISLICLEVYSITSFPLQSSHPNSLFPSTSLFTTIFILHIFTTSFSFRAPAHYTIFFGDFLFLSPFHNTIITLWSGGTRRDDARKCNLIVLL